MTVDLVKITNQVDIYNYYTVHHVIHVADTTVADTAFLLAARAR